MIHSTSHVMMIVVQMQTKKVGASRVIQMTFLRILSHQLCLLQV